jgi:hypothetical protein
MAHVKAEDDPLYFVVWRERVIIPAECYGSADAVKRAVDMLRLLYARQVTVVPTVKDLMALLH